LAAGRAVRADDLAHQLVPRLVGGERRAQIFLPLGARHVPVGPALHQHHIKDLLHVPGVFRRRQETVDQLGALVGGRVGEEGTGVGRGRNAAGQVETDPAQELGVIGLRRHLGGEVGFAGGDGLVDALVQRRLSEQRW
jgi:hypothetical protein